MSDIRSLRAMREDLTRLPADAALDSPGLLRLDPELYRSIETHNGKQGVQVADALKFIDQMIAAAGDDGHLSFGEYQARFGGDSVRSYDNALRGAFALGTARPSAAVDSTIPSTLSATDFEVRFPQLVRRVDVGWVYTAPGGQEQRFFLDAPDRVKWPDDGIVESVGEAGRWFEREQLSRDLKAVASQHPEVLRTLDNGGMARRHYAEITTRSGVTTTYALRDDGSIVPVEGMVYGDAKETPTGRAITPFELTQRIRHQIDRSNDPGAAAAAVATLEAGLARFLENGTVTRNAAGNFVVDKEVRGQSPEFRMVGAMVVSVNYHGSYGPMTPDQFLKFCEEAMQRREPH